MIKPPRIEAVEVVGPTQLRIAWTTGERLEVDLAEPINRLKALAPLRDPATFSRVQVGEWGHSLVWDGEIDLGADRLYERCKEQAGEFSPGQFDAWIKANRLSLTTAAEALGLSRRMVAHYRTGSRPIPKVVALACKGWEVQSGPQATTARQLDAAGPRMALSLAEQREAYVGENEAVVRPARE
ncbi:MAG: DUF2442 domain-containing protein [Anaerolineae bacterium]